MSRRRRANLVLLCEDALQETLLRRFLVKKLQFQDHQIRAVPRPVGQGAAEAFVRRSFRKEVHAYRKTRNRLRIGLLVVIDGDQPGLERRRNWLLKDCPRRRAEAIAVLVPTWSIETWILDLDLKRDKVKEDVSYKRQVDSTRLEHGAFIDEAWSRWNLHRQRKRPACVPSLLDAAKELEQRLLESMPGT